MRNIRFKFAKFFASLIKTGINKWLFCGLFYVAGVLIWTQKLIVGLWYTFILI